MNEIGFLPNDLLQSGGITLNTHTHTHIHTHMHVHAYTHTHMLYKAF
uniref:Uncharacterized protein n=1 Tax=Anguilla anguilla TaxID=7936 RepID=A0A0E9RVR4_ANGAN